MVGLVAKVLIVEDDEVIARGMAEHLQAAGFDAIAVGAGEVVLGTARADDEDRRYDPLAARGLDQSPAVHAGEH